MNPVVFDVLEDLKLDLGMDDLYDVTGPWLTLTGLDERAFEDVLPLLPADYRYLYSAEVDPAEYREIYPDLVLEHRYPWGKLKVGWKADQVWCDVDQVREETAGRFVLDDMVTGFKNCLLALAESSGIPEDEILAMAHGRKSIGEEKFKLHFLGSLGVFSMSTRNPPQPEEFIRLCLERNGVGESARISRLSRPIQEYTAFPRHKSLVVTILPQESLPVDTPFHGVVSGVKELFAKLGDRFESFEYKLRVATRGTKAGAIFEVELHKNREGHQTTYIQNVGSRKAPPGSKQQLKDRLKTVLKRIDKKAMKSLPEEGGFW